MVELRQFKRTQLLGVEVDAVTIESAVAAIVDYATDSSSPAVYVIKPYVEFLDRAARDPEIKALLNGAALSLPDGVALQWAASFLSSRRRHWWQVVTSGLAIMLQPASIQAVLPERVSGVNFTWPLLEACVRRQLTVFLVGRPVGGQIEDTVKAIQRRWPELQIAGSFDGYAANRQTDRLVSQLQQTRPDIVLVGLGFPRQEQLMAKLSQILNHGVLIGEGGTFDYQSFGGRRRRAPAWIQRSGLEWLWRLILEPSRWRRQLAIPRFVWRIWRQAQNQT